MFVAGCGLDIDLGFGGGSSGDGGSSAVPGWPHAAHMNDVGVFDEAHVVVVGDSIHTTGDGGITWQSQPVPGRVVLKAVACRDGHAWAVGGSTLIIHSSDFGQSWTIQNQDSGGLYNLVDVDFATDVNGWAVGGNTGLLHTTNGGATWGRMIPESNPPPKSVVAAPGADVVVVAGSDGQSHVVVARRAAGDSAWTRQTIGISDAIRLCFITPQRGWLCGGKSVWGTSDAGGTWTALATTLPHSFTDLSFVDADHGWSVSCPGEVNTTVDGGVTWSTHSLADVYYPKAVAFANASTGWVVWADAGLTEPNQPSMTWGIQRTTDGGATWTVQYRATH
jgi:photosystem II stability/assembly factor-like uncharacterized protein